MNDEETHIKTHNSNTLPIIGCTWCDKEINRPIQKCFGEGKGEEVIPSTIVKK